MLLTDPKTPAWNYLFQKCGAQFDQNVADTAAQQDPWCRQHGIATGYDYLMQWIATMFRRPSVQLPYLFLYSTEQNTGKSSLPKPHHPAMKQCLNNKSGIHIDHSGR